MHAVRSVAVQSIVTETTPNRPLREDHYVAERFFGRSANRRGEQRARIFQQCPWDLEGEIALFCYECHEELIHNPVFLPGDIVGFAELVRCHDLNEDQKTESREKLAGRIKLLHEVIQTGIQTLLRDVPNR
jgi:hypothetical protein